MKFAFFFSLFIYINTQIYISSIAGSDLNNGSFSSPLATFTKALELTDISKPSIIQFMDGIYFNLKFELNNVIANNLTIQSSSGPLKTLIYKPDLSSIQNITERQNNLYIQSSSMISIIGIQFIEDSNYQLTGLGSLINITNSNNITFSNCLIQNGNSEIGGGAYITNSFNINFISTGFFNNNAKRSDMILQSIITQNRLTFFNITTIKMTGNTPFFNKAEDKVNSGVGGAIYVYNSTLNFNLTLIRNNTATSGGAIYQDDNTFITVTNSVFEANIASNQGSLIYSSYLNAKESFVVINSNIKDHVCKVWYCKLIYSESWQNANGYKLSNYAPDLAISIDIILIIIIVLAPISGIFQFYCIFLKNNEDLKENIKSKVDSKVDVKLEDKVEKKEKQVDEIDEGKIIENQDITVQEELEKQEREDIKKEEEINDGLPSNITLLETLKETYENINHNYITLILDRGIFSTLLQLMFSLSGITYSDRIPMVWRIVHSFFICFLFIAVSIRAFFVTFSVPVIFYDYFDVINMIFGILEYVLFFSMPSVVYISLIIVTNLLKKIIFRERDSKVFAVIVLITSILLVIGAAIAIITSSLVLEINTTNQSPVDILSTIVYIIFWTGTSSVLVYLIVVVVLLVSFMTSKINDFFNSVEYLAKKGKFSYEEAVVNYARLKLFLSNTSFSISYFLVPLFIEFGGTIIIGIVCEIWGIDGFFAGRKATRYAIIVMFGIVVLFLLISFAIITQQSASGKTKLYDLIIKVGNEGNIKKYTKYDEEDTKKRKRRETKINTAMNTIKEIHRFNEFLSTNLFVFSLFELVPLYITTIVSYATLFASLFAAAKSAQTVLSSSLYSY